MGILEQMQSSICPVDGVRKETWCVECRKRVSFSVQFRNQALAISDDSVHFIEQINLTLNSLILNRFFKMETLANKREYTEQLFQLSAYCTK